jgi:hypothetical protein
LKILKTKNRSRINERFTKKRSLKKENKKKKRFLCWDRFIFYLRSIYTHFRIYSTKFTTFLIYKKWSFLINFSKIITKNSIWILIWSKWSTSQLTMREMKISRLKSKLISQNEKNHSQWWMKVVDILMFKRIECDFVSLMFLCWSR